METFFVVFKWMTYMFGICPSSHPHKGKDESLKAHFQYLQCMKQSISYQEQMPTP